MDSYGLLGLSLPITIQQIVEWLEADEACSSATFSTPSAGSLVFQYLPVCTSFLSTFSQWASGPPGERRTLPYQWANLDC